MSAVLLTRPRADSEQLAAKLKSLGYDSVIESLLFIVPSERPAPDLARVGCVMITSGNALDTLNNTSTDLGKLIELPCFCVGTRTANKARQMGFKDVHDAAGDGEALAKLIVANVDKSAGLILHIAGNDIDSTAANALKQYGRFIIVWAIYSAEPAAALSAPAIRALKNKKLDAVLIFSTRTAEALKALLLHHKLEACCRGMIAIGISESVLAPLQSLPWLQVAAAGEPTEAAVLARLQKLLPIREFMNDTPESDTSPTEPEISGKTGCGKKKASCLFLTALIILAVAGVPLAFYFCPWFLNSHAPVQNTPQIESHFSDLDRRVQLLENRFLELSGRVSSSPVVAPPAVKEDTSKYSADVARLQSDVVALSSALSALQVEVKQINAAAAQSRETTQALLGGAIAFIQLREAALSGHSFTDELAAFRTAAGNDADLQKLVALLEPYATQGSPSFSQLHDELIAHEASAANNIEKARAQNWWERIVAEFKSLVSVRPLHGNEVSDSFAALETALNKNDASAALNAYKNLAPEAQQALSDLHAHLQARAAIDEALRTLAGHYTSAGSPIPLQDAPP